MGKWNDLCKILWGFITLSGSSLYLLVSVSSAHYLQSALVPGLRKKKNAVMLATGEEVRIEQSKDVLRVYLQESLDKYIRQFSILPLV